MKYTTKTIEEAAKKLHALPAKKRAKSSTSRKAVQLLHKEFAALLERGYSLAQAGRALHRAGIQISPLTAQPIGGSNSSPGDRATRAKATPRASAKPHAATPAPVQLEAEPASPKVPPPPLPPLPSLRSLPPRSPTQPNPAFQRGDLTSQKATFRVRPDTPDSEL